MTVQQLIDALNQVPDKSLPVRLTNWQDSEDVATRVEISDSYVEILPSAVYGDDESDAKVEVIP